MLSINNEVLKGFNKNLEEKHINYQVADYLNKIDNYWKAKRKKEKVKKPKPKFNKTFISEIERLKKILESVPDDREISAELRKYINLSNDFIKAWKEYSKSTP